MPVQIPPGFAQASVELRHEQYARPAYNVWGWGGAAEYDDPTAAANAFMGVYATLAPILDPQVRVYSVRLEIGQDGGEPVIGFSDLAPYVGTRSGTSVSPALAVRGIKRTGLGGRRNRGSFFLPWAVASNNVTEQGNIVPAALTATQTAMSTFFESWDIPAQGLFILHGTGNSEIPAPTPITGLTADPIISNQVRRQVKRG